jgi:hypothetical protein
MAERVSCCFGAIGHSELVVDVGDMAFDGIQADDQLFGDLAVDLASGEAALSVAGGGAGCEVCLYFSVTLPR